LNDTRTKLEQWSEDLALAFLANQSDGTFAENVTWLAEKFEALRAAGVVQGMQEAARVCQRSRVPEGAAAIRRALR
jgi:hypothetical protein